MWNSIGPQRKFPFREQEDIKSVCDGLNFKRINLNLEYLMIRCHLYRES